MRLSAGYEIGLPFAFVGWVTVITFTVFAWRKGDHRRYPDMVSDWRAVARVGLVLSIGLTLGLPWAFFPWSIQYHEWVAKSGTVATIGNRFTDGQVTTDTAGTVIGDFVVQFSGDPTRYDCKDTRCALVHPGDRLTLSCIRSFRWSGIPGWYCNYTRDEAS